LGSGFGEGVVDILGVEDGAHAEGVADDAFFVFAFHFVLVIVLGDDDADDERMRVSAGDECGAAAVSGEGGEIGEESGMGLEGEEGRAGEYPLAGHGEAGAVGLEALGIGEDEERATDVDSCGLELRFGCEDRCWMGGDFDGEGFGDAEDRDVLIFVANPKGVSSRRMSMV
jgi:hypothetical protein